MKQIFGMIAVITVILALGLAAGMAQETAPPADTAAPAADAEVNPYVGDNAKTCAMCHKAQVEAWKEWPMAKSWEKLSAEEQTKEECIKCHVTGYGKPGGWVSFEKTPKLVGIQCEACHGPAGDHMKVPLADVEKKKSTVTVPDETLCVECHKEEGNPNFKPFVYKDAVVALDSHKKK